MAVVKRKKRVAAEQSRFQFTPETFDASYSLGPGDPRHHLADFNATQSIQLEGPITFPEKLRWPRFELWIYAGSEQLARAAQDKHDYIGSAESSSGILYGHVWVHDQQFPTLMTMALSGRLRCASLHMNKSIHRRGAWMIVNLSLSTQTEV